MLPYLGEVRVNWVVQTMSIKRNRTKIPIESIEYIRTQSNDCDSIVERNRISIESEILGKIRLRSIDTRLRSIDIRLIFD